MEQIDFELQLLEEARDFLKSLTKEVRGKIGHNIRRVQKNEMRKVGDMKLYDFEELLEEDYGPIGTPERDEFERSVDEAVHAYKVGEAIRQARLSKNLTQEQLGERMGVQKSQISRLEKGKSISFSSLTRAFKALGIPLSLDMAGIGKVALW